MHKLFLSLGTNLGNKEQNLLDAIEKINKSVGTVMRQSTFISTDPVDFVSENTFLNAAVLVHTNLSPEECLNITQKIERDMGRTRKSVDGKHFDRIIDIDILLYDDLQISSPRLTIPHPKMYERDFVMIPLKEIL
ncbi:MAG: 2-amino-4-hydroxy-6-hydroxymethyldihydropteridine diphosphokinase [Bacteroidaceae bacterium]|nr:2-amino-4-hydroxy-6-hydroxymethyldihydropteridine diphosphokinase [Bacteroidaceae bacterium]